IKSVMPVSARKPVGREAAAGVASYRVCARKYADAKNDNALAPNAMFRPAMAVTAPPIDAPSASIADHVALDSALACSRSSGGVTWGMVACRAGSKKACAPTAIAITTYAIHT